MIEWIMLGLLGLVVAAVIIFSLRDNRQSSIRQYCDLECKDCEGCRR